MYIFIAIVFIAELIIACTLINFIVKIDRQVRCYNCCVSALNPLLETGMKYVRALISNFKNSFENLIVFVNKKQEQILYKTIAIVAIYSMLLLFKIKRVNVSKIYKLADTIQDIVLELAV